MGKIQTATQWMINLANDDSHGYDQTHRWGPDYDCSSAVISAWQYAGVPVKTNGATYTGNMYGVFTKCGFSDVTSKVNLSTGSGIQYGDVLLNTSQHTVMSIGNGQIVTASKNENNGYTGGKTGDQTGKEIRIRSYYNHPWNYVLRYTAEDGGDVIINPPSKNEYEIKRYTEHGTAYPRTTLNIRSTPNASEGSSNVVGKYYNGEHVVYDLVVITNKYVYVSWIGASGNRRYMAVKDQDTGNRYADCK